MVHSLSEDLEMGSKEKEPVIIAPIIELEEKKETPVVRHTLDLETEEDEVESFPINQRTEKPSHNLDLIPTSDIIKNINVVYNEVSANIEDEEDFIIKPVTRMSADIEDMTDVEVISDYIEEEQQITLTFDMPLSSKEDEVEKEDVISYDLSDDLTDDRVKNIAVNDYVELITVNETNEEGDIRYALDDYSEVESSMNQKQNEPEVLEEDQDVVFERKVVKQAIVEEEEAQEIDPMNTPISELLKESAEERRRKMKDFNYKFNSAKIDDIEKVPAYKRQGVNLSEAKHSSETDISRTSIGLDDNDDNQLRSNNSFLHDNVD